MVDFEGGIYCRAPWWIFLLKIMFFFRSTFYILAIVNRPHAIFSSKNSTGPLRGNQRNLLPRQLGCSGSADLFLSFMFGRVSFNKSFFYGTQSFVGHRGVRSFCRANVPGVLGTMGLSVPGRQGQLFAQSEGNPALARRI